MRGPILLTVLILGACGKLGPECQRLSECCEAMPDPVSQKGCLDTLEEHGTDDGAETYCRSAADVLKQAGTCRETSNGTDAGTQSWASCDALRQCCQQISSGPYRSDCLLAVGQMELQPESATSCRLSLEGYVGDGWCEIARAGGPEDSNLTCNDGVDNDGNGHVDCNDWACSRNPEVTVCARAENDDQACRDGLDNDADGYFDCDDYDCSRNPSVRVCG